MVLPSRIHAVVLVSRLHKPTLRALAYARATRPDTLTALTVSIVDPRTARALQRRVGRARHPGAADHRRLARTGTSPARCWTTSPTAPGRTRATWSSSTSPSTWSAAGGSTCCTTSPRCGSRPGCCSSRQVMVTNVPWQLDSSRPVAGRRPPHPVAGPCGSCRLGLVTRPARLPGGQPVGRAGSGAADAGARPAAGRPVAGQRRPALPGGGRGGRGRRRAVVRAGRRGRLRPAGQLLLRAAVPHPVGGSAATT